MGRESGSRGRGRSAAVVAATAGLALLVLLLLARVLAVDGEGPRETMAAAPQPGFDRGAPTEAAPEEAEPAPAPLPELPPLGDRAIPRERSIRGRVTDASGAPVPDAVVTGARKVTTAFPHAVEKSGPVRTDADGTFVLGPVEVARPHAVFARKEGAGVASARDAVAGAWVDLVLVRGARVEGRVAARGTGRPIAGATVFLRDDLFGREARADAEGRYALDEVLPAANPWSGETLLAVAEGFRRGERSALTLRVGQTATVDFALDAGAVLSGTVRDERNAEPIAGAIVGEGWEPWHRRAETDATGRYRLEHVEVAPNLVFHARGPRHRAVGAQSDGSATLDFALPPALALRARVFAPDGAPVQGARVYLLSLQRPQEGEAYYGYSGFTPGGREPRVSGADGTLEFPDVSPGTVVLVAFHAQFAPGETRQVLVPTDGPPPEEVRVELRRGFSVSGIVVDEKDRPLPDVQVRAQPQQTWGDGASAYQHVWSVSGYEGALAYTDAQGRFAIGAAIPSKPVWLYAGRSELGWTGVSIEAGEGQRITDVRISFAGARIGGVVLDAEGRPVPGAQVQARGPAGDRSMGWRFVQADAMGRFLFGGLKEGSYTLSGWSPFGSLPQRSDVPSGTMDVELKLAPTQALRGVVRSAATGGPVERFRVAIAPKPVADARGRSRSQGPQWEAEVRAPDGTFERYVTPGNYLVTVRAPGHAPRTVDGVAVEEGVASHPIEFLLEGGASLRGTLRDAQGRPVPGVVVHLRRHRPKELGPPPPGEAADQLRDTTDAGGRYVFDGVGTGAHIVTVALGERGAATAQVNVPGVDDVHFDLQLRPTGQARFLVKDEEGKPVQGVGFYLQDEEGNWLGWAGVTDASGAAVTGPVREGPARAYAWQNEPARYAFEPLHVHVVSQQTVVYDVVAKKKEG